MKYYFWILGCAMNYSDAERMATVLDSLGYTKTEKESEANLFIVISCSVRQSAIDRIYGKVRDLKEYRIKNQEFRTILTGCVLAKDKKKLGKVFDIMMEINDLNKLPELLGIQKQLSGEYLATKPHYDSTFRAYVPISTGCDNFCTYCAVPYTRGREKSRPMDEIIKEVRSLISNGYKEITLLGQNVNSYGSDKSYRSNEVRTKSANSSQQASNNNYFSHLLHELDKIPGDHRIYFYSNHPKDMTEELIETMVTLKHFPHYIHLPLQSGNDEIIRKMNRHYTKERYLGLVEKIRKTMPDIVLTTDIIVGFPGETEKQFKDTIDVMEKAEYDMAFIAQYSPREGTLSAKMIDNISEHEKRRREDILQKILGRTVLEHNKNLIGTTQRILVDEVKKDRYYGRTEGFKVTEIKTDQPLQIGQFIDVKIESASSWKFVGIII